MATLTQHYDQSSTELEAGDLASRDSATCESQPGTMRWPVLASIRRFDHAAPNGAPADGSPSAEATTANSTTKPKSTTGILSVAPALQSIATEPVAALANTSQKISELFFGLLFELRIKAQPYARLILFLALLTATGLSFWVTGQTPNGSHEPLRTSKIELPENNETHAAAPLIGLPYAIDSTTELAPEWPGAESIQESTSVAVAIPNHHEADTNELVSPTAVGPSGFNHSSTKIASHSKATLLTKPASTEPATQSSSVYAGKSNPVAPPFQQLNDVPSSREQQTPPAIAQFPGYIQNVPNYRAKHDTHGHSIH